MVGDLKMASNVEFWIDVMLIVRYCLCIDRWIWNQGLKIMRKDVGTWRRESDEDGTWRRDNEDEEDYGRKSRSEFYYWRIPEVSSVSSMNTYLIL